MNCAHCLFVISRTVGFIRKRIQIECSVTGRFRGPSSTCDLSPTERAELLDCAKKITERDPRK